MNSRIKRKLRVLSKKVATGNKLSEKGQAKVEALDEKSKGKLVRKDQKNYFEKQCRKIEQAIK